MKGDKKNLSVLSLVKKDLCGGKQDRFVYFKNQYFHEPRFIANPNGVREDDGMLLSLVLDGNVGRSYVGLFDAKDLSVVSKAWLPTATPFTLHGHFFENEV